MHSHKHETAPGAPPRRPARGPGVRAEAGGRSAAVRAVMARSLASRGDLKIGPLVKDGAFLRVGPGALWQEWASGSLLRVLSTPTLGSNWSVAYYLCMVGFSSRSPWLVDCLVFSRAEILTRASV